MMIRAQWRLKLLAFFRKILSLELRKLLPLLLLEVAGPVSWLSLQWPYKASANIDMLVKFLIYVDIMWYTSIYIMYVNEKLHYWWVIFKGLSNIVVNVQAGSLESMLQREELELMYKTTPCRGTHSIWFEFWLDSVKAIHPGSRVLGCTSCRSLAFFDGTRSPARLSKAPWNTLAHIAKYWIIKTDWLYSSILKTIQHACALLIRPKNSCHLRKSLSQTGGLIRPFCPPDSPYSCGIDSSSLRSSRALWVALPNLVSACGGGKCADDALPHLHQNIRKIKHIQNTNMHAGKGFLTIFSLVNFLF